MAKVERINFSRDKNVDYPAGTHFYRCNFSQVEMNTVLMNLAGKAITFEKCNLRNVTIDAAWTLTPPNSNTQKTFCSHLRPNWVADGSMVAEALDCEHMISSEPIIVDGVTVGTAREYRE